MKHKTILVSEESTTDLFCVNCFLILELTDSHDLTIYNQPCAKAKSKYRHKFKQIKNSGDIRFQCEKCGVRTIHEDKVDVEKGLILVHYAYNDKNKKYQIFPTEQSILKKHYYTNHCHISDTDFMIKNIIK